MRELVGPNVPIIAYSSLAYHPTIESIFGRRKQKTNGIRACIILYQTSKANIGHWSVLIEYGPQHLEFFCPLGMAPDQLLEDTKAVKAEFRKEYYLTDLIKEARLRNKYKLVEYSKAKLQTDRPNVGTCGRWCGLRCLFARDFGIPLEVFQKLFIKQQMRPDMYVTALTAFAH